MRSVTRRSLLATAFLTAVTGVSALDASAATGVRADFQTPSRNIGCHVYRSQFRGGWTLECQLRSKVGKDRYGREGLFTPYVTRRGRAHRSYFSGLVYGGKVLAYGRRYRRRGFVGRSRRTGLTCRNLAGHGFTLSRERQRLF